MQCPCAGHNSDGKFIARAQRIEYDCELVPRRVAIFIEKTKDGQILPVPNVVVRDVACGANHTVSTQQCSPLLFAFYRCLAFCKCVIAAKKRGVPFGQLSLLQFAAYTCSVYLRTDQQYALKDKCSMHFRMKLLQRAHGLQHTLQSVQWQCRLHQSCTQPHSLCIPLFTACPGLPEACFLLGLWWLRATGPRRAEG